MGPTSRASWAGAITALAVAAAMAGAGTVMARALTSTPAASPAVSALPTTLATDPQVAFARGRVELVSQELTLSIDYATSVSDETITATGDPVVETDGSPWYEGDSGSAPFGPSDDEGGGPSDASPAPTPYAYVSTADAEPGDVYVRAADGTTVRVTCDDAHESHPVVSSDGTQVAYASDASGQWRVMVAAVASCESSPAQARPVGVRGLDDDALSADRDQWPSWGPSDSTIVFQRSEGNDPSHLYVAANPWDAGGPDPTCTSAESAAFTRSADLTRSARPAHRSDAGSSSSPAVRLTYDDSAQSRPDVVEVGYCDYAIVFTTTQFHGPGSLAELRLPSDPLADPQEYRADDPYHAVCPVDVPGAASTDSDDGGCELGRVGGLGAGELVDEPSAAEDPLGPYASVVIASTVSTGQGSSTIRVAAVGSCVYQSGTCGSSAQVSVGAGASHPDLSYVPDSCAEDPDNYYATSCTYLLRYTLPADDRVVASVPAAGSAPVDLTVVSVDPASATDDASPAYTPDGARILVSSAVPPSDAGSGPTGERQLRVIDPAAGTVAPQPSGHGDVSGAPFTVDDDPAPSPDGSLLSLFRVAGEGQQLVVVDSTTGAARASFDTLSGGSWAPDGTHLVTTTAADTDIGVPQLATVDVGTPDLGPVPLTMRVPASTCAPGRSPAADPLYGTSAAWSPDGRSVAVTNLVVGDDEGRPVTAGGVAVLTVESAPDGVDGYVVTAVRALTGTDLTPGLDLGCAASSSARPPTATPTPTPSAATVASSSDPAWSSDGSEVYFTGRPVGQSAQSAIYAVAPDGTGLRTVASVPGELTRPTVQPVGDTAVTLAVDHPTLDVGQAATLTVTAANVGAVAATPTVVVEIPGSLAVGDLPAGCTGRPSAVDGVTEVTCTPATLAPPGRSASGPGSSAATYRIPVVARAAGTTQVAGAVVNPGAETALTNNVATVDVTVVGSSPTSGPTTTPTSGPTGPTPGPLPPGLTVTAAASGPELWVGGHPVTVTFTVRNTGAGPATGVTLTTSYPDTVTVAGDQPCLAGSGACPLATIAPGGERVLTASLVAVGPAGTADVTATIGAGDRASTTVRLQILQPWLRPGPTVARPGQVVIVHGEDFPPGSRVTLTWSPGITAAPGPYTVADDGTFDVQVLVLGGDVLGGRYLRATSGSPAALTTPRVVTPPTDDGAPDAPPCPASSGTAPGRSGPAWCEVDAQALVVPPAVDSPSFLERG